MGREIKRVDVDFNWPLDKVWEGFLNPHDNGCDSCGACKESGLSPDGKRLKDQWYGYAPFKPADTGSIPFTPDHEIIRQLAESNVKYAPSFYGEWDAAINREALRLCGHFNTQWMHHLDADDVAALIKQDRLWDFTRVPRTPEQKEIVKKKVADGGNFWLPKSNGYIPTPKEVNEWSLYGLSHDSSNQFICVRAKAKRLGLKLNCVVCKGKGYMIRDKKQRRKYNAWKPPEPPAGTGWQVWETVSEGSPISPVFANPLDLVDYLAAGGDEWDRKRCDPGWGYDKAKAFVNVGHVPSGLIDGGKFYAPKDIALHMQETKGGIAAAIEKSL